MMLTFEKDGNKFNYRTASIVIHNEKVLFQKVVGQDYWFLPGGRVEFFEEIEETIEREMQEEYGVSLIDKKLVWFVESFFELNNMKFHEIGTYF